MTDYAEPEFNIEELLIEYALSDNEERDLELINEILASIERLRQERTGVANVQMGELELLADDYDEAGKPECAAGVRKLIARGYAEQVEKAARSAPLN
jgi:hypothetical protein